MNTFRLLLRSLTFYWRTHVAVLLGVAAGAAVIGGALVVGDSVQASLRKMTLQRLGDVDYALSGSRFFTEVLAGRVQTELPATSDRMTVAPALSMRGGLTHTDGETVNRAGGVGVFGVDERLWKLLDRGDVQSPGPGEAVLNSRVADALGVKVGDDVALNIEVPSAIPRESLLGERNDLTRELPLTVAAILPDELGASRFGLNPSQQIPPVAFVALGDLQNTLDLAAVHPSRRNPAAKPARVNSLYVGEVAGPATTQAMDSADKLTVAVGNVLTLADLGLRIVPVADRGYVSLESTRMILDDATVDAAHATVRSLAGDGATASPDPPPPTSP
ncbi:MAG: ABC transporter permease, partial [Planctomycetaceae bacterium]